MCFFYWNIVFSPIFLWKFRYYCRYDFQHQTRINQRSATLAHMIDFFFVYAGVVREACRERGQIRLTFTAGTGEENKPRAEDR